MGLQEKGDFEDCGTAWLFVGGGCFLLCSLGQSWLTLSRGKVYFFTHPVLVLPRFPFPEAFPNTSFNLVEETPQTRGVFSYYKEEIIFG